MQFISPVPSLTPLHTPLTPRWRHKWYIHSQNRAVDTSDTSISNTTMLTQLMYPSQHGNVDTITMKSYPCIEIAVDASKSTGESTSIRVSLYLRTRGCNAPRQPRPLHDGPSWGRHTMTSLLQRPAPTSHINSSRWPIIYQVMEKKMKRKSRKEERKRWKERNRSCNMKRKRSCKVKKELQEGRNPEKSER